MKSQIWLGYTKDVNKIISIVFLCFIVIGFIGWQSYGKQDNLNEQIVPTMTPEPTDFTASFEIYTNGTKRIFTAAMYHNQSPDVFIQSQNPSIVYVTKTGITWAAFFETLPFSLTKQCLITGTKQTFCTSETKKLRFFLNNIETPDALEVKIQPGDELRVTYGV